MVYEAMEVHEFTQGMRARRTEEDHVLNLGTFQEEKLEERGATIKDWKGNIEKLPPTP